MARKAKGKRKLKVYEICATCTLMRSTDPLDHKPREEEMDALFAKYEEVDTRGASYEIVGEEDADEE